MNGKGTDKKTWRSRKNPTEHAMCVNLHRFSSSCLPDEHCALMCGW